MLGGEEIDEMAVVGDEEGLVGDAGAGGFFGDVAGAPLRGDVLKQPKVMWPRVSAGSGETAGA